MERKRGRVKKGRKLVKENDEKEKMKAKDEDKEYEEKDV